MNEIGSTLGRQSGEMATTRISLVFFQDVCALLLLHHLQYSAKEEKEEEEEEEEEKEEEEEERKNENDGKIDGAFFASKCILTRIHARISPFRGRAYPVLFMRIIILELFWIISLDLRHGWRRDFAIVVHAEAILQSRIVPISVI